MSGTICPYCGADFDLDSWPVCDLDFEDDEVNEYECPECERTVDVYFYMEPTYTVHVPDELKPCAKVKGGCKWWDLYNDCCAFNGKPEMSFNKTMLPDCPLGHKGVES